MLDENIALGEIRVNIRISGAERPMTESAKDALSKAELSIVSPPVEFSIECSYGNKGIKIDKFSAPVKRTIAITNEVDPEDLPQLFCEPDGTIILQPGY